MTERELAETFYSCSKNEMEKENRIKLFNCQITKFAGKYYVSSIDKADDKEKFDTFAEAFSYALSRVKNTTHKPSFMERIRCKLMQFCYSINPSINRISYEGLEQLMKVKITQERYNYVTKGKC